LPISSEIVNAISNAPGFDETSFREIHENGSQVVSVRINPSKSPDQTALSFDLAAKVPWSSYGYYLAERPIFTFDPLLHAGAFYVQEASSMFLEQAMRQHLQPGQPVAALDLCAAPGGKSTHIQSLLPEGSVLVSNEVIRSRVTILEENLVKWGAGNVVITNSDPRDFSAMPGLFDLMVIDAPCSGSGMFRRDPASMDGWSTDLVTLCSERQQRILADAWPALKEGGLLIYSTCSYSVEENERVADWIIETLGAGSLGVEVDPEWNIVPSRSDRTGAAGYRFYPDRLKGEGFYLAVFRKTAVSGHPGRISGKPKWEKVPKLVRAGMQPWLENDNLEFISISDNIIALSEPVARMLPYIQHLYIRSAGISIGKWAKTELVPAHHLAMSNLLSGSISAIELDKNAALQYLRREEIPASGPVRGWSLVKYRGHSLGWIKNLGNRANNYYPKEWRILRSA
jgi:16S rRNA C967 or C1407 C5-methylase (RsmB/RsmF family)/NOL1/NOP2/fmu family ribosome biogenesis protein